MIRIIDVAIYTCIFGDGRVVESEYSRNTIARRNAVTGADAEISDLCALTEPE